MLIFQEKILNYAAWGKPAISFVFPLNNPPCLKRKHNSYCEIKPFHTISMPENVKDAVRFGSLM